jgi:hypothetical protein
MLLGKVPVPVPLLVLVLSAMVGFSNVLHTTPRAVTDAPPLELTVPPLLALVPLMLLTAVVVRVGGLALLLVKESWLPYAVPTELVA